VGFSLFKGFSGRLVGAGSTPAGPPYPPPWLAPAFHGIVAVEQGASEPRWHYQMSQKAPNNLGAFGCF